MKNLLTDARNSPLIKENCIDETKDKRIPLKDEKTSFCILNKKSAPVYTAIVDKCLMKQEQDVQKCDFVVNKKGTMIILLMEFKGNHLGDAEGQLKSSQKFLSKHLQETYRYVHILVHRDPPTTETQRVRAEHPYANMRESMAEETIENLMRRPSCPPSEAAKYKPRKQSAAKKKSAANKKQ